MRRFLALWAWVIISLLIPATLSYAQDYEGTHQGTDVLSVETEDWSNKTSNDLKRNNIIYGTYISEGINGHEGNDIIYGFEGRDTLRGGEGHDVLYGGDGGDTLRGYDGNDILYGGSGYNLLNGGRGADVYVLEIQDDVLNIVIDFNPAEDKISVDTRWGDETTLSLLKESAQIDWTNKSDSTIDQQPYTNSERENDTVIYSTKGTLGTFDDRIIMVLQDFDQDLTMDMFDIY